MAGNDWYPRRLAERPEWHNNFMLQSAATGLADGLTAPIIAQIAIDADTVAKIVNYDTVVDGFSESWSAYMRAVLDAPLNTPVPAAPVPPDPIDVLMTLQAAIQARTRQYAGLLKAHPGYTVQKGEIYRIVAVAPSGPGTPAINSATALLGGEVSLSLLKAGYQILAVDMRRGGGSWAQIGVSQTASYLDTTDNATPETPEQREYRIQGIVGNQRVGPLSAVVPVVTLP